MSVYTKSRTTDSASPSSTDLEHKQLAFNEVTGALYTKILNGDIKSIGKQLIVNSISDLSSVNTVAHDTVRVLYYSVIGDGGGGVFKYDSSLSAVNDGVIHFNGWVRQYDTGHINVNWAGVIGDGITPISSKLQTLINNVGADTTLYFPVGEYVLDSEISIPMPCISIVGLNRFATSFKQTATSSKVLNVSGSFFNFTGISIRYDGTPISGAEAIYITGSFATLQNFIIRSSYTGIHIYGGTAVGCKISNFEVLDYESSGILCDGINDCFVSDFIINAGTHDRGMLGGIRLLNKVEALVVRSGDVIFGRYSMTMDSTNNIIGSRPSYNHFTDVYFDSGFEPTVVKNCVETDFVSCWFSGGRQTASTGVPGLLISDSESVRFSNCLFFNNGGHGVLVNDTASDITFTACKAESNSNGAGVGVAHGFFLNGCDGVELIGCVSKNGLYTGQQGYGVFVVPSTTNFAIRGGSVKGNYTGGIVDATSDTTDKFIVGVSGYKTSNSGIATILLPSTSVVVNHGLPFTPMIQDIQLTRVQTNAGAVDLFVHTVTATTFTIQTNDGASIDTSVAWSIKSKGA